MHNKKYMVSEKDKSIPLIVEKTGFEGVRKIALKSAEDMEMVIGTRPQVLDDYNGFKEIILFATIGRSCLLSMLEKDGKIDLSMVEGHREVYGIYFIENPFKNVEKALVVAGSDKLGTIYGIFTLSEKFGISPLIYWGDATVKYTRSITFSKDMEEISGEPSVKYRGFFINDEWPCFGSWASSHFGGFCAEMYDKVFELLLRLKGNYLWPAMWSSSFALDGPGDLNEKLADEYGIIIGNSHHEPCLRAGEEWDIYKKENKKYGTKWNYKTNKDGLLQFWKDGLKRSGKYRNIITVGMRGERDSVMPGSSSLEESIQLWKDIITEQDKLISRYADTEEHKHKKLLVIYKETEEYFYGTELVQGLKNWEGLNDKIIMFCDDNYGYLRRLPDKTMQKHKGGLGMYYHLDYHGAPISYEWINTTQLSKIWEQMSQAYEYGIKEAWVVNAGDIKGNELPLSYFMAMAYNFEKWGGSTNLGSYNSFIKEWVKIQFGNILEDEMVLKISEIINENINIISMHKPEAMNSTVYHPCNYEEADYMLRRINSLLKKAAALKKVLPDICKETFYSIAGYPLFIGMNSLLMNLYAGKNEFYAKQGKACANKYRNLLSRTFYMERRYKEEFQKFKDGKWQGMELGQHTGFVKWNEDGCRLPFRCTIELLDKAQLIVSRPGEPYTAVKNYGTPDRIEIKDFLYPGGNYVKLEIGNGGNEGFECHLRQKPCSWIKTNWTKANISSQEILIISCKENKLPDEATKHTIYIVGAGAEIAIDIWGCKMNKSGFPKGTFFGRNGCIAMYAGHASYILPASGSTWQVLSNYGKLGSAYKAIPDPDKLEPPVLGYYFVVRYQGTYCLEIWSAPANPVSTDSRISFGLTVNNKELGEVPTIQEDYKAGEPTDQEWCNGVLEQVHKTKLQVNLNQGLNKIEISATSTEFVLEGMFISSQPLKESYLGPQESYYIN